MAQGTDDNAAMGRLNLRTFGGNFSDCSRKHLNKSAAAGRWTFFPSGAVSKSWE